MKNTLFYSCTFCNLFPQLVYKTRRLKERRKNKEGRLWWLAMETDSWNFPIILTFPDRFSVSNLLLSLRSSRVEWFCCSSYNPITTIIVRSSISYCFDLILNLSFFFFFLFSLSLLTCPVIAALARVDRLRICNGRASLRSIWAYSHPLARPSFSPRIYSRQNQSVHATRTQP